MNREGFFQIMVSPETTSHWYKRSADPKSIGMLLEIGKKNIVGRNALAMEPFDRNCSYGRINISKPSILDYVAMLLVFLFDNELVASHNDERLNDMI